MLNAVCLSHSHRVRNLKCAPDVSLHGGPVVVASKKDEDFGVGDVLEVGVILANEVGLKRSGYHNARREISILVDGETVTERERGRVQGFEKFWLVVLGVFPSVMVVGEFG